MADDTNTDTAQDDFDVPLDQPDGHPGSTTAGTAAADESETNEPEPGQLPLELAEAMRRERLPVVQGETTDAAYARLTSHLQGRNRQLYISIKEGERARKAELAEMREMLTPMLRDYYQRQRNAEIEAAAAEIPDKETDPEGYKLWVQEEVLRRLDAAERGQQENALTAEQQEAERQVQEQLAKIDESGYSKVAEGLGLVQGTEPDPDFSAAYDTYSESATIAARQYFPEASDEQIQEFVALSQQLDIRRAEMNGVDIRDVMKMRMNHLIDSLVRRGLVTRAQGAAAKVETGTGAGASGNGHQPAQPAKAQPAARAQAQRTVAQAVRADAAASQRRAPNAVAANTRPNPGAGQLPDASAMEEDDFVEAALAGLLGDEEQRAAPHRRQR